MPAMKIEAVAGLHPYGTLEELSALLAGGHRPYPGRGFAECPPAAFANLKPLGAALRRMPRLARLALAAALSLPHFRSEGRTGAERRALVVATAFGSVTPTFDFMDSILADGPEMASPTAFSHSVANMAAAMLGQHLRLTGPAVTVTDAGGSPFVPALFTAAGLLESGSAETIFLCAAEEGNPVMNGIASAHSCVRTGMEGAVLFALSRGVGGACPHMDVSRPAAPPLPGTPPAVDVHGPGILSLAWNAALSFLALRNGAAAPIRCLAGDGADEGPGVLLSMGATP